MSQAFIGEIRMFSGTFAPRNWAFCNGQIMQVQENQAAARSRSRQRVSPTPRSPCRRSRPASV